MVSRVGIFWDYENCHPNATLNGRTVANNIRNIALQFGTVTTFKAYVDVSLEGPRAMGFQAQLQASGVSMIHCPHDSMKEVVDRALTVDMLVFAFDSPPPATVIVISGDRDFSYAISTIRMRGHRVVLIMPTAQTPANLKENVDVSIHWKDVLAWPVQATFATRAELEYKPLDSPSPIQAQVVCPMIAPAETPPRLLRLESAFSDASEDAEMVVISRPSSAIEKDLPPPSDEFVPMQCTGMASDASQSEWQIIEEGDLGTAEIVESLAPGVHVDAFIEDCVPIDEVETLVEVNSTKTFDGRTVVSQSSPGVGRMSSSTNSSMSVAEPEVLPEDIPPEEKSLGSLESQSGMTGTHRVEEQCSQMLRPTPGFSNYASGSSHPIPVRLFAEPVHLAPSFNIPEEFRVLVKVMRKGNYFSGNAIRFDDLISLLQKANREYHKGHGGAKKYIQKARDSRIVKISGSEKKTKFFVELCRPAIPATGGIPRPTNIVSQGRDSRTTASIPQTTGKFAILVDVLKELHSRNSFLPQYNTVGTLLLKRDPDAYSRVGCSELRRYLEVAREANVVYLGPDWVQLRAGLF